MRDHDQFGAYAAGLGAVLAWSTVATAFKISLAHLSPAQLLFWANLVSLAVLLGILISQGRLLETRAALRQHWRRSLLLGAVNPFAYYLVLFQAYSLLPAQEAQAINYTWALTLTLLSVPVLKQRLRRRDALAALVCYLGVLAIATHGKLFSLHFGNPRGVMLALVSTLLWAGYWLANTRDNREPVIGLTLNFSCSLPLIALWCAWRGELTLPSWTGLAGAAYVGAFEMGFTFVLWLFALKRAHSAARIANLIFLSPLVSLLLIHWLLGEAILPSTLAGLGLILAGLLLQKLPAPRALAH
ncbi:DMT family transporter [Paludibacterium purpuratum]|uniref:Drug/metabolite transporter (DMT)-like permease n=1 Tax=Paludibacterium purpuratum TaxID=1144873 RepID=A0A4R7BCY0_9NEIS|nr:DMT family transporter [Paludibacterium purpuratum]TDR81596.1 drug/metabolite transporter (DMT)-like permease [Paludibacterium purpuratum]